MVRFALSEAWNPEQVPAVDDMEAAFLRQIGALHAHGAFRAGRGGWSAERAIRTAPRSLDPLARDEGPAGWSVPQVLNFLLLREIPRRARAAVVATVRDEALGLVEWVAHYRVLGFERIFVYTNHNSDGTDALLDCLAGHGLLRVIHNEIDLKYSPQRKAYAHALQCLPDLYECAWAFFVDADEFYVPASGWSIDGLLDGAERAFPVHPPAGVLVDWRWYVSGARFEFGPGLVQERFRHFQPHGGFKSLVRLGEAVSMRQVHYPEPSPGGFLVDSDMTPLGKGDIWAKPPSSGQGGYLNHYWSKSFEEFSIKKARGDTLAANAHGEWARTFDQFFSWNGAETADNLAPSPEALLRRVAAEHDRIMALPEVAWHVAQARARLPEMLARFEPAGGLRHIYDTLRQRTA